MASFKLRCIVCPGDPTFSDVSHLLTHISSKGHLSHYFKTQVRSRKNKDAEQRLVEFDQWYLQNDIERLLEQRLKDKDSKSDVSSKANVPRAQTSSKRSSKKIKSRAVQEKKFTVQNEENVIDPALYQSSIDGSRAENQSAETQNVSTRVAPEAPMGMGREASASRSQSVHPIAERTRGKLSQALPSHDYRKSTSEQTHTFGGRGDRESDMIPSTPPHSPSRSYFVRSDQNVPTELDLSDQAESDEELDEAPCSEPTRLKGIVWPGMDVFDSAGPVAKRKRNQKKESSVLEKMRADSESFEPTEVIRFYPSWDLKMERFISGEVESSPIKDETPVREKAAEGNRAALKELDSNSLVSNARSNVRKPKATAQQAPRGRRKPLNSSKANRKELGSPEPKRRTLATKGDENTHWNHRSESPLDLDQQRALRLDHASNASLRSTSQLSQMVTDQVIRNPLFQDSERSDFGFQRLTASHERVRARVFHGIPTNTFLNVSHPRIGESVLLPRDPTTLTRSISSGPIQQHQTHRALMERGSATTHGHMRRAASNIDTPPNPTSSFAARGVQHYHYHGLHPTAFSNHSHETQTMNPLALSSLPDRHMFSSALAAATSKESRMSPSLDQSMCSSGDETIEKLEDDDGMDFLEK